MRVRAFSTLALLVASLGLSACAGSGSVSGRLTPGIALAEARANVIAVSPEPGVEDASPSTQISFLGGPGTRVTDVSVVGSQSGPHSGTIEPYSTGTGASFVPNSPFVAGEQVAVHALAGTGTPQEPVTSVFTIAHPVTSLSKLRFPNTGGDPRAVQHYASAPGLTPSTVRITTPARRGAAPGYLFLAPYEGRGRPGVMIARQDGTLVWFHPLGRDEDATNFHVQRFEGKPVLTWWQGRILRYGFGQGEDVIYDSSYHRVASIRAGNGFKADLHEIRLTPHGTAWIDAFYPVYTNLSSVGGSRNGVLSDVVVQEIDVKTGLVMWEWHALGHIPLRDSYNPVSHWGDTWDYAHVNSISPGSSGDVLLSARNTWALYDVDIRTGAIRWQLGGKHSTFKLGPGTRTYWQHDAEWQRGGLISVFDNGAIPAEERQSRGVLLRPNIRRRTVTLVKAFVNPAKRLLAPAQGNVQSLPGGDWLMGYGNLPNFTEYDSAGRVLLDGTLGHGVQDFRAYLDTWSGRPTSPPQVAVERRVRGPLEVLASWNGATAVATWRVLTGSSPSSLKALTSGSRTGFQTAIPVSGSPAYVAVQALDSAGGVLGTSSTVRG